MQKLIPLRRIMNSTLTGSAHTPLIPTSAMEAMNVNNLDFPSAGIDNLELRAAVSPSEWEALRGACLWSNKEGIPVLLKDKHGPLILLQLVSGKVLANLNVPKLSFGHNVLLAGPEQVRNAIRILETNTSSLVPRLDWKRAEVSGLHVTFTHKVNDFEAFARLSKAPRGTWEETEYYPNIYHNAKSKNEQVIIYDKLEHLRNETCRLTSKIDHSVEMPDYSLYRFEARPNQSPCSQLRAHGGWNGHYLLAEDLIKGPGFIAALNYLQWKFKRHVPIPSFRLPALGKNPSMRAYAQYNDRATANENPGRLERRAIADHRAGAITDEVLVAELERAELLERIQRARGFHEILSQECGKQIAEILVSLVSMNDQSNVAGQVQIQEIETEHATREHGHAESLPGYSF